MYVRVVLCLAVFLPTSILQAGPIRISTYPSPAYYGPGSEISVTCIYPREMTFRHWVHPRDGIISLSRGRFVVTIYNDGESKLEIQNAREEDDGEYRCVIRDGALDVESDPISASYRLPINVTSPSSNTTIAAGENLNLTCNGEHFIYRQWTRVLDENSPSSVVSTTDDGRIEVTSDYQLLFRGILPSDEAQYRCTLGNDLGTVRVVVNVKVVVRPVISVNPADQVVETGAMATISCHVIGTPLPVVTWMGTDNAPITSAISGMSLATVSTSATSLTSNLTIMAVERHLAGLYTCHAQNSEGINSSYAYINLAGSPNSPRNVILTVVNQTNILVTWEAPNITAVTNYVVTWVSLGGSEPHSINTSSDTSYTITGLDRLTTYRVYVFGENSIGTGRSSVFVNTTTTAVVPGTPLSVTTLNVRSSSVRVEWSDHALPADDGGAPIVTIRLSYRSLEEGVWSEFYTVPDVDVDDRYAVVTGLMDRTTYQIRMQAGNVIGFGEGIMSDVFFTPKASLPEAPSNVTVLNITRNSVVLCWTESPVGRPFTNYGVEIMESGRTNKFKVLNISTEEVGSTEDCGSSVEVTGLHAETCYTFVVYAANSQGAGQPSPASPEYCTVSCVADSVCSTKALLSTGSLVGVVVGGSVGLLAVILTFSTCLALRQYKKSALRRTNLNKNFFTDNPNNAYDEYRRDSEQSVRSTTGLLGSPRSAGSSSSSKGSGNSMDNPQPSPDTDTTMVCNPDQNPFDFTEPGGHGTHAMIQPRPQPRPQPVLQPHQMGASAEYPQQMGANIEYPQQVGASAEYPQQMGANIEYPQQVVIRPVSDKYPMYPILENPPPYQHHLYQPQLGGHYPGQPLPAHMTSHVTGHGVAAHGMTLMTDNPNYEERGHVARQQHLPPDMDGMTYRAESEVAESELQIPTPHFGESYSQSGYSPVMQRSQGRFGASGSTTSMKKASSQESDLHSVPAQHAGNGSGDGDGDEEDMEFVDNDVYITFTPKFEIVSEERGNVFETVQVK